MKERDNQDLERKREVVKHSLEGAALVALTGLALKLLYKDGRVHLRGTEAGDLVNSTVVKALSKAHKFREEAQVSTWLHRIQINTSHDLGRQELSIRAHQVNDPEPKLMAEEDPAIGPELSTIIHEEHEKLMSALKELSETQRVVVFKFYFEGMTYEQIAEELEMPVGTVKSHASRGLAQLRTEFGISEENVA